MPNESPPLQNPRCVAGPLPAICKPQPKTYYYLPTTNFGEKGSNAAPKTGPLFGSLPWQAVEKDTDSSDDGGGVLDESSDEEQSSQDHPEQWSSSSEEPEEPSSPSVDKFLDPIDPLAPLDLPLPV